MPYVNQRWLGGLLTNFQTISKRIKRLHELTRLDRERHAWTCCRSRERIAAMHEREKLETNLGGVADMQRPPDAVFVVDLKTEAIGVREAERLRDPDHRPGGHELRPGPGRLRDPRQRRRDPLLQADHRRDRRRGRRALARASAPRRRRAREARARGGRGSAREAEEEARAAARPRRQQRAQREAEERGPPRGRSEAGFVAADEARRRPSRHADAARRAERRRRSARASAARLDRRRRRSLEEVSK